MEKFEILHKQWTEATCMQSSTARMARHPAYQEIISMGDDAVKIILNRFKDGKIDHYFFALNKITKALPVQEEHLGIINEMAKDWIKWGEDNGLV